MKKLTLLIAAGTLWLFLAAVPAFADGGPHTSSINNGVSSLTADSCAGCHRVHTAKGPLLLNQATEEDLCLACHGDGLGATTDVLMGVQYEPSGIAGEPRSGTELGALRGGGFEEARIGDPFRSQVNTSRYGKVTVASVSEPVNSAHMPGLAVGLTQPGIAWGNGANGSGAGPVAEVSCGSCHNPHGNGQFRILNTIPGADGINTAWGGGQVIGPVTAQAFGTTATDAGVLYTSPTAHGLRVNYAITVAGMATLTGANVSGYVESATATTFTVKTTLAGSVLKLAAGTGTGGTLTARGIQIYSYTASTARFQSVASHGLLVGDKVTITGNTTTNVTDGVVAAVPSDTTFTVTGITAGTNGLGGTAIRNGGVKVTDAPPVATTVARNYTVIQDPKSWAVVVSYSGTTFVYTTAAAHGFEVGDTVNVTGMTVGGSTSGVSSNTTGKVATATTTTFTLAGVSYATDAIGGGAASQNDVLLASEAAAFDPTDGDYMHYRMPWNTAQGASTFDAPNGIPGGGLLQFTGGFSEQVTMWCAQCHSRYYARSEPTNPTGGTGAAYSTARPGDAVFTYQHRTNANSSNRGCLTCHVSHGSNAAMTGEYSANFTFPNGTESNNSRLLKIDNRGTCQQCHEPTATTVAGDQFPVDAPFQKVALASANATTDVFTTSVAHGLAVGDQVNIAANVVGGVTTLNTQGIVESVGTSTTFSVVGVDIAADGTGGTVGKMPATP